MKKHHFTFLSAAIAATLCACSAQDNAEGAAVYADDSASNGRGQSTGSGAGYDNNASQTSAEAGEGFDQSASGGAVGQPADPNGAPSEEAYAGEDAFDQGDLDSEESEPTEDEATPAEIYLSRPLRTWKHWFVRGPPLRYNITSRPFGLPELNQILIDDF